jgi:outer membrane receptor protein involved in Fe transport
MKTITTCVLLLLAIQVLGTVPCFAHFAQASSSTAELRGQVLDPSGAALTGASVSVADLNKGTKRTVTSDDDGYFTFLNLPPSSYELVVEATGFASNATRIDLTVGQQAQVPIRLEVGTVTEVVSVIAGSEVVEVDRTQQSSVVDEKQIANLPISRRNYLDYALLTPGVTDSDNIADASDFRVVQTQQSGLSFGGNNGRGNLVAVDGGETNTASGGVQAAVGQEAVQEFQVLRNSFNAEFGGASGGIVNIVSKSGANRFSGSAFALFRDDTFDARNAFDFDPDGESPFDRQQFGGSFGGPLDRDETFFFTSVERFSQDETTFVNLLNDPNVFAITPSQDALFDFLDAGTPFAALSGPLRAALTTSTALYPRTVALFDDASGQFPFESSQTIFTARVDHVFSDDDTGYIRLNLNDSIFENNAAGALTAVSRGRTLDTFNGGILLSEYHRFSDRLFNEVKAQFTYLGFKVIPNDLVGPEINIEGFGFFGRDIFLPSATIERHYDVSDNVSLVVDTHTYKFGGSVGAFNVSTANETFFGGRFNFGAAIPLINLVPAAVRPALQGFLTAANPGLLPALATPINALQAYNLNLPIVYQQGFGTSKVDSWTVNYAFYGQDTWKVKPNFTLNYGLRYSVNDEPFYLRTDTDNWQPRGGFSWDPFGDGRTSIRGGAGIFAGYTIYSVPNVTKTLSGLPDDPINIVLATATSAALGLPSSFAIYQTLLAQGVIGRRPITAADLAQFGVTPRPGAPLEVRFRISDDYETPTTYQASFGVQRDLGEGFSLDVSYLYTRGLHLTRNRDVNQFKQTGPVNAFTGQRSFIRFPTPEQAAAGLTSDFRNPLRLQDNVYESTANSFYHALTISLQRRFANNFGINVHYTFSKAIDEVTDFNSDFSAQNPLNVRLDRALSAFDQRHRAVFSGVFESPVEGDSALDRVLADWVVSPVFIAGSGRPFNLLLGFDANNDGRSQSDRPFAAGRNTGLGEPFYSFDLRVARRFTLDEHKYFEFTFEAFNLFNHTNLLGINNVVGSLSIDTLRELANETASGDRSKAPTQPLGFTSAAAPRQLQFGVRFNF